MRFTVCTPAQGGEEVLVRFRCSAGTPGGTHVMSDLLGLLLHSGANVVDWRADVGARTYMTGYITISRDGLGWLERLLANGVRGAQLDLQVIPDQEIATIGIIAIDEPGIQERAVAELAWREIPHISSRGAAFHAAETGTKYYACNLVVFGSDEQITKLREDFSRIADEQGWEVCSVERGFQLLDFAAAMSLE